MKSFSSPVSQSYHTCLHALVVLTWLLSTTKGLTLPTSSSSTAKFSKFARAGGSRSSETQLSLINTWKDSISDDYQRRLAADPRFLKKSITEVFIAGGTQLLAEAHRRGAHRLLPEFDFVFAGVLTAIAGKYYAMWKVAPTKQLESDNDIDMDTGEKKKQTSNNPTNAFQSTCLDGSPVTPTHRLMAILNPMPSLFRAGILASAFGYGITRFFIFCRTIFFPSYVAATQNISVFGACIFTGVFLAVASNLRYQIIQGVIEPKIIYGFFAICPEAVKNMMVIGTRLVNGYFGSILSIEGMKFIGLQKLK